MSLFVVSITVRKPVCPPVASAAFTPPPGSEFPSGMSGAFVVLFEVVNPPSTAIPVPN